MNDLLVRFLGFLLAAVVGGVIGVLWLIIRRQRNLQNWPTEEKRLELLGLIRDWKVHDLNYSQRLERLIKLGYTKDVADALLGEAERPGSGL